MPSVIKTVTWDCAEVRRLEELGATVIRRDEDLTTMADPEGNEFCVEPGPAAGGR